jgi:hypothetical protein
MKPLRSLWITLGLCGILVLSVYFSDKKRKELATGQPPTVVVDAVPPAAIMAQPGGMPPNSMPTPPATPCKELEKYGQVRSELGTIVNKRFMREHETAKWVALIDEFRRTKGLPLAMGVTSANLEKEGVVYNNCKPSCRGAVHQVFVSRIINGRFAEVLTNNGTLKKISLEDGGIAATTIDELNKKGIPFRSWIVPMADGPWFILGNNIYYKLDIEGLYLRISSGGEWKIVSPPLGAARLFPIAPPKVVGCDMGLGCFTTQDKTVRRFKAPLACASVVKHATDEVTDEKEEP